MAVPPDGRHFATGSDDERVRVWALDRAQPGAEFRDHVGSVLGIAFAAGVRSVLSASDDWMVCVRSFAAERR